MYDCIYFDLDDTLIRDNPVTGKSEILDSGLEKYKELSKRYPNIPKILFTNRYSYEIKYPSVYSFDEEMGNDDMKKYIKENIESVHLKDLLSLKNIYVYLCGIRLYRNGSTPKLLYIFLKNVREGEKILVLDDDRRVSGMFGE
jgi:hypothetical protein